jgi:hypothetical protein
MSKITLLASASKSVVHLASHSEEKKVYVVTSLRILPLLSFSSSGNSFTAGDVKVLSR